ncbi:MAG: hypothetical protein ACKO6A_01800 [Bacteroidota bacterium]
MLFILFSVSLTFGAISFSSEPLATKTVVNGNPPNGNSKQPIHNYHIILIPPIKMFL